MKSHNDKYHFNLSLTYLCNAAVRPGIAQPAPSSNKDFPSKRLEIADDAIHLDMTIEAHHIPNPVESSSGLSPNGSSA